MAQLSDDCFAFGGELMLAAKALARLGETTDTVATPQEMSLHQAHGGILARDVLSARDVPPHDNAAVDGWAVFFDDLNPDRETNLPWSERIPAGRPLGHAVRRGVAVRVFTGAPMPVGPDGTQADGPDTVFMAEDFEPVSAMGDRTLRYYRHLASRNLGPSCPLPGAPAGDSLLEDLVTDWLDEFERVHLLLRLSGRLRTAHKD